MSKSLLITGATGKQGGATINALLDSPSASEFTILAVTRNPDSNGAKALASRGCKLVKGDLNDVPAIFSAAKAVTPSIWGVFSVQIPMGQGQSPKTEEAQGKALIDEALKNNVQHFVYTSVDRQGDHSWENPTNIPHFISKHNIELHLRDSCETANREGRGKMTWTILRPVAFLEGFQKGFMGSIFNSTFKLMLKDRPLQFVATADIGHFAAESFIHPSEYAGRAITLAGDEVTFQQAKDMFERKTGETFPEGHWIFGWLLTWLVKEVGLMFQWFFDEGYKCDIQALRKEWPGLLDMETWLEKESPWKGQIKKSS